HFGDTVLRQNTLKDQVAATVELFPPRRERLSPKPGCRLLLRRGCHWALSRTPLPSCRRPHHHSRERAVGDDGRRREHGPADKIQRAPKRRLSGVDRDRLVLVAAASLCEHTLRYLASALPVVVTPWNQNIRLALWLLPSEARP